MSYHPFYILRLKISSLDIVTPLALKPDLSSWGDLQPWDFGYRSARQTILGIHQSARQAAQSGIQFAHTKQLGQALFNALLGNFQRFGELYKEVRACKAVLRLEISVDINEKTPLAQVGEPSLFEVAGLPWEFMYATGAVCNLGLSWLGTAPDLVVSRRTSRESPPPPIQLQPGEKLRIALAVSAPTASYWDKDLNEEREPLGIVVYDAIHAELEKFAQIAPDLIQILPILNPATCATIPPILDHNQRPHIFHFIGHARFNNIKNVAEVALADRYNPIKPDWISAEEFSNFISASPPTIVILQACESATVTERLAFGSLAAKLVERNIPVVVAMQYEISNDTAIKFVNAFYQNLIIEQCPVDQAVQKGRLAIRGSNEKPDFATPVLFMWAEDGTLFRFSSIETTKPGTIVQKVSKYEDAVFVSYVKGGDSELIIDDIEQAFAEHGITIVRDKKDIGYKGSIQEFEQRIGQGKCVILVIDDKYLRSEHCMYELVAIEENQEFRKRIFPIVLEDAHIYKPIDRLAYIQYWDEQIAQLNQAIKQVNLLTNLTGITSNLNKYARIRAKFDHLTDLLSDMNALTPGIHAISGFSALISAIKFVLPERLSKHEFYSEIVQTTSESGPSEKKHEPTSNRIANPFGIRGRIENCDLFMVRKHLCQEVFDELSKNVSISLVGASQTGKSSLLWYICSEGPNILKKSQQDFIYLDMELIHSEHDFFGFICEKLDIEFMRGYQLAQKLKGRKIIVCLDEIEKMVWEGFTINIRSELRGLADGTKSPFVLLISSRNPLETIFQDSQAMPSPLANICNQISIPPFSLDEAKDLVHFYLAKEGLNMPVSNIEKAWRLSNGCVGVLQHYLHKAFEYSDAV